MQPKYSVSGRVLGGITKGNFSGDTNHNESISTALGLWPDGYVFAAGASIPVEYNLTPNIGLRVAPEYYFTGFGSIHTTWPRLHHRHRLPLRQAVNVRGLED